MRYLAFLSFLLVGCAGLSSGSHVERFSGYWSVGAPFSEFSTSDGKHTYYIFEGDMPPAANSFLDAQPDHYDSTSESGSAQSAYFEVLGTLYTDKSGYQRLHVQKVLRMAPADAHYLARYGTRPKA